MPETKTSTITSVETTTRCFIEDLGIVLRDERREIDFVPMHLRILRVKGSENFLDVKAWRLIGSVTWSSAPLSGELPLEQMPDAIKDLVLAEDPMAASFFGLDPQDG